MTILKPAPEGKLPQRDEVWSEISDPVYALVDGRKEVVRFNFYNNEWQFMYGMTVSSPVIWYEAVEVPDGLLKDY